MSISQTRGFNVFFLLLSCAPGSPTSLSILVRACLCCSLKGVVHTVVGNLQFLGNFSHGIAFISQTEPLRKTAVQTKPLSRPLVTAAPPRARWSRVWWPKNRRSPHVLLPRDRKRPQVRQARDRRWLRVQRDGAGEGLERDGERRRPGVGQGKEA